MGSVSMIIKKKRYLMWIYKYRVINMFRYRSIFHFPNNVPIIVFIVHTKVICDNTPEVECRLLEEEEVCDTKTYNWWLILQKWYEYDIVNYSTKRSDIQNRQDVGGWVWYSIKYQKSREPTVSSGSHYFSTAEVKTI